MTRILLFALIAFSLPLALDYYVFRNWRRFAQERPRLRWTLPVYRVLLGVMPFAMPLYALTSRWWEVEPKLARAFFIGFWITYYGPKVLIALVLMIKDALRFIGWLFGWFQRHLLPARADRAAPKLDLTDIKRTSRRDFLQTIGWSAASVPFVLVGYSAFRTLYDFEIYRVEVPLAGLPRRLDGLTIAQLSDLHAGSFFSDRPMVEAVALTQ